MSNNKTNITVMVLGSKFIEAVDAAANIGLDNCTFISCSTEPEVLAKTNSDYKLLVHSDEEQTKKNKQVLDEVLVKTDILIIAYDVLNVKYTTSIEYITSVAYDHDCLCLSLIFRKDLIEDRDERNEANVNIEKYSELFNSNFVCHISHKDEYVIELKRLVAGLYDILTSCEINFSLGQLRDHFENTSRSLLSVGMSNDPGDQNVDECITQALEISTMVMNVKQAKNAAIKSNIKKANLDHLYTAEECVRKYTNDDIKTTVSYCVNNNLPDHIYMFILLSE